MKSFMITGIQLIAIFIIAVIECAINDYISIYTGMMLIVSSIALSVSIYSNYDEFQQMTGFNVENQDEEK